MAAYHQVYGLVTCGLTANDREQLRNPKLVWDYLRMNTIVHQCNHHSTDTVSMCASNSLLCTTQQSTDVELHSLVSCI